MEEDAIIKRYIELYSLIQTGYNDYINFATNELQKMYQDPESIIHHVNLLKNCSQKYINSISIIILKKLIKLHIYESDEETCTFIMNFFIDFLKNDINDGIYDYINICECIDKVLDINNKFDSSSIFHFARSLINDQTKLNTSICLWSKIIYYYNFEDFRSVLFLLIKNSIDLISTDNFCINGYVWACLSNFLFFVDVIQNKYEMNIIINTIGIIQKKLHYCIENDDIEHLTLVVNTISDLYEEESDFFTEFRDDLLSDIINLYIDGSKSLEARKILCNILESGYKLICSLDIDKISMIIQNTLNISVCLYDKDMFSDGYMFPITFFDSISQYFMDEDEEIFSLFFSKISELSHIDSDSNRIVCLMVLYSIIEGLETSVSNNIEEFLNLVLRVGNTDNQDIVYQTCMVIRELTNCIPDSLNAFIEELNSYLIQRSYLDEVISTMDNMFYKLDKPPTSLYEICSYLTNNFEQNNSYRKELIISCITSSLHHVDEVDESIFKSLFPIISSLFYSNEIYIGIVLECCGRLSFHSPLSVLEVLDELSKSIINGLNTRDDKIIEGVAICIESLAEMCHQQFTETIKIITPKLLEYAYDFENEKTSSIAVKTLSKIICFYTDGVNPYIQEVVEIIIKKLDCFDIYFPYIFEGIGYIVDGLKKVSYNIMIFMEHLMPMLLEKQSAYLISGVLLTLGQVFSSLEEISDETSTEFCSIYISIFQKEYKQYLRSKESEEIDYSLIRPLFFCLTSFIHKFPENFRKFVPKFFDVMRPYLESNNTLLKHSVLNIFSIISRKLKITSELYTFTLNATIDCLDTINLKNKKIIISALNNLLIISPDKITQYSQQLLNISQKVIVDHLSNTYESKGLTYSAISMFFNCIIQYNIEIDDEDFLSSILTLTPPPHDSYELVDISFIIPYLKTKHPNFGETILKISSYILSSMDFFIDLVDTSITKECAIIVNKVEDKRSLLRLLNFNQHKYSLLIQNYQKYLTI